MFYHDLLKKELFDYINSEYSKKKIKEVPTKSSFNIEIPTKKEYGDVSTNIAMVFAKKMGLPPRDLALKLSKHMNKENFIEKLEVVGPGFLNIFFKKSFWQDQLKVYFKNVNSFDYSTVKKNICLEFVSANPTGLMHIGHARGAVLGDTIASILEEVGHKVTKEYYINDAGEQIKKLKKTVKFHLKNKNNKKIKTDDELYPGEYLKEISKKIHNQELSELMLENSIIKLIMNDIKEDLFKIKIKHDSFISEKECSSKKNIDEILKKLNQKKLTYYGYQEKPKSLNNESWERKKLLLFKSQEHGDETDRALIKSNGELTYFMTDIIYHQKKIDKKFDILLNIWGSDHSGYVKRLQSAIEQLNKKANYIFEIKLTSLVNLLNGKQVVKMSKREGNYVTLREVVNKVGPDVLRYMMISRSVDKKIDFDFDFRIRGICNSKKMLLSNDEIDLTQWIDEFNEKAINQNLNDFVDFLHTDDFPHTCLIDCTASNELASFYPSWLSKGIHIITPNKKGNSGDFSLYQEIQRSVNKKKSYYFYEATVGAGLPLISTLKEIIQTGDEVIEIEGVFSGTLSYIFNQFGESSPFSKVVIDAKEKGYTEPDPREDLSGLDVARKAIILAREMGHKVGLEDVQVEDCIPQFLKGDLTLNEFMQNLKKGDQVFEEQRLRAFKKGELLRYGAKINSKGEIFVSLRGYPKEHPFCQIKDSDNIVLFKTKRYNKRPLIIQGPGAGPEVTAGGIFSDLIRLTNSLGKD